MWHTRRMRLYTARFGLVLAMIAWLWIAWLIFSIVNVDLNNISSQNNIVAWNLFVLCK